MIWMCEEKDSCQCIAPLGHIELINKELEMYLCILSTVVTDALVLKHQVISSYWAADIHCIGAVSYKNITFMINITEEVNQHFEKNYPVVEGLNHLPPGVAYMRRWIGSALVQVMACPLFGDNPLPEPVLAYYIPRIPVSEGSGDVMVLRRSRPPPATRHPPPAAHNGVNVITQKPRDGLFSNLVYTLVVIVSWPD